MFLGNQEMSTRSHFTNFWKVEELKRRFESSHMVLYKDLELFMLFLTLTVPSYAEKAYT
jgi:hypothetical protein